MAEQQPVSKNKKDWRQATTAAAGVPTPGSKRRTIFKILVTMAALLGIIVAILFVLRVDPDPKPVVFFINNYEDELLPVNAWAGQDAKALTKEDIFAERSLDLQAAQEWDQVNSALKNLGGGKRAWDKEAPLVMYLSAHVVYNDKGELYLLPGDAKIDDPSKWLLLSKVFQALHDCQAPNKLLILDVMHPLADPRLGLLVEDVADRVHKAAEAAVSEDPKLVVLGACSPGQVALVSQELGHSVFGYYLREGLRGWADGYNDDEKRDHLVSVRELADFVTARVDRWARENLGLRQTPFLLPPNAADFSLVKVDEDKLKADPAPAEEEAPAEGDKAAPKPPVPDFYPTWLRLAWKQRDALWENKQRDKQAYHDAPLLFRKLETTVLHFEELWRGGADDDANLNARLTRRLDENVSGPMARALASIPKPATPRSLALALALTPPPREEPKPKDTKPGPDGKVPPPEPTLAESLNDLVKKWEEMPSDTADALKLKNKFAEDAVKKLAEGTRDKGVELEVCRVLFDKALDGEPKPERIKFLASLVASQSDPNVDRYVETLLLRRLKGMAEQLEREAVDEKKPFAGWPQDAKEAVRTSLQVVRLGEQAAACVTVRPDGTYVWDPRPFPWLRAALTEAAQLRHEGEVLLFAPHYASGLEADKKLARAKEKYLAILSDLTDLQDAYQRQDEALARLPSLAAYFLSPAQIDNPEREREEWSEALSALGDLHTSLAHPPKGPDAATVMLENRLRDVKKQSDALGSKLENYRRKFGRDGVKGEVRDVSTLYGKGPKELLRLHALLEIPWLQADDRAEVFGKLHKFAAELNDKTLSVDRDENKNHKRTRSKTFDAASDVSRQKKALRRATVSLDLLQLARFQEADKLRQEVRDTKLADWPLLGARLRKAWEDLAADVKGPAPADPGLWDLRTRVLLPVDASEVVEQHKDKINVALEQRQEQTKELWTWLADRYQYELSDLSGLLADDVLQQALISSVFQRAVEDYSVKGKGLTPTVAIKIDTTKALDLQDNLPHVSTVVLRMTPKEGAAPVKLKEVLGLTADEEWLQIPEDRRFPTGEINGGYEIRLPVKKKPEVELRTQVPRPNGFLLEAVLSNGLTFHQKIDTAVPRPRGEVVVLVFGDAKEKEQAKSVDEYLFVRPNLPRKRWVFVKNPTTNQDFNIRVDLKADNFSPVLSSKVFKLAAGQTELVRFEPPVPLTPGAKDQEAPPLKEPSPESPVVTLQVVNIDDPKHPHDSKKIGIRIRHPSDYIKVKSMEYLPEKKELNIRSLSRDAQWQGPDCKIQVVFPDDPRRLTGLIGRDKIQGADTLVGGQPEWLTRVPGLRFLDDRSTKEGEVDLTVDGYERAFIYRIRFGDFEDPPSQGIPVESPPVVRIVGEESVNPKDDYKFTVEVDNAPPGIKLEAAYNLYNNDEDWRPLPVYVGDRERRVLFNPFGQDGELTFTPEVKDWSGRVPRLGVTDRWKLRVLMKKGTSVIKSAEKDITPDNTEPVSVSFVRVNKTPVRDQDGILEIDKAASVVLVAHGEDPESKIKEVYFMVGGDPDDPKGKWLRADRVNAEGTDWAAEKVALPFDREETVAVKFVNGVGLSTIKKLVVRNGKKDKPEDKTPPPTKGKIKGKVFEGDRTPAAKVQLLDDATKKEIDSVESKDGDYNFDDVAPGKYIVKAKLGKREDEKKVTVEAGKTSTVDDLKIRLK